MCVWVYNQCLIHWKSQNIESNLKINSGCFRFLVSYKNIVFFFFKEKNNFVLIMGSNNEIMNFQEKKKLGKKNAKVTTNFTIES